MVPVVALMITTITVVVGMYLAVQSVVFISNLMSFPVLKPSRSLEDRTSNDRTLNDQVSLLVPVRDEADVLPDTLPTWLAQDVHEIVILNDASSDGTADILDRAASENPNLKVLHGEADVPAGWNGKNWACHRLSEQAEGHRLLFVDADVFLEPNAVAIAVAEQEASDADLLTVWPRQRLGTPVERMVVPLVDMILLGGLPAALVNRIKAPTLSGANGQFMLWTGEAYARSGGHAAVRGDALEDVKLARKVKQTGGRLALRLGGRMVRARMYRTNRAVAEGFSKNVREAAGSAPALVFWTLLALLAYTAVWPLAFIEPHFVILGAAGILLRAAVEARSGRSPMLGVLQPIAPLMAAGIVALALQRGRSYRWKGRTFNQEGSTHAP